MGSRIRGIPGSMGSGIHGEQHQQQHVHMHMLLLMLDDEQDILSAYGYADSMSCPITGNTLTKFVMTVKAQ